MFLIPSSPFSTAQARAAGMRRRDMDRVLESGEIVRLRHGWFAQATLEELADGRRLVVVKWLRAEVHEGSEAASRFHREAQLMAGARFDGVIKVEDYGSDEFGRTWMAMEFVDGVSPAGAIAAARVADRPDTWQQQHPYLVSTLSNADLELTRAVLSLDDAAGFALIEDIAQDENDPMRLEAMKALAMAGRDGTLVADWLKRMSGEVKDPLGGKIGEAVALSNTVQADEWRRATLQQGVGATNLRYVYLGVFAGRGNVTRNELLEVLFSTPESARAWTGNWILLSGTLPEKVSRNLATGLMFGEGANLMSQPGLALLRLAQGQGAQRVFLEVRPSNPAAIALYLAVCIGAALHGDIAEQCVPFMALFGLGFTWSAAGSLWAGRAGA